MNTIMAFGKREQGEKSTWSAEQAAKYKAAKHGPDGALFLDPHLYQNLVDDIINGKRIADLGCGTGPWLEHCLKAEHLLGIDINQAMLDRVPEAVRNSPKVELVVGDINQVLAQYKEPENQRDILLSVNVGCNLPDVTPSFFEAYDMTKPGGSYLVAAPISLDVPFQTKDEIDIQARVDELWQSGANPKVVLNELNTVMRATFVLNGAGKPVLVTRENVAEFDIECGSNVLRKIPGLTVDNNWQDADAYTSAAEAAGWEIAEMRKDRFESSEALADYNGEHETSPEKQLGSAYAEHSPFLFLKLTKPVS